MKETREADELINVTFQLYKLNGEPKKPARLICHHVQVLLFTGAGEGISPVEIHPLAFVQSQELFRKDT
jgi:hypothetical protein